MTRDEVVWRTPQPLWAAVPVAGAAFGRPALLRFAGDDFMEQATAAVGAGGPGLAGFVAGQETWRDPGAGLGTAHERPPSTPVRIFQPVHGRFYLVAASLVCRRFGHPDHAVSPDLGESVSFLLRRLHPVGTRPVDPDDPTTFVEAGWVPAGDGGAWRQVDRAAVLTGEARLPLFPVAVHDRDRPRRLHAGLVPVGARETFTGVPTVSPDHAAGSDDPLAALADPRLQVLESVVTGLQGIRGSTPAADPVLLRESAFFALVDLAHWLDEHLDGALEAGSAVLRELDRPFASTTWRAALATALANESAAFAEGSPESAPVAGLSADQLRAAVQVLGVQLGDPGGPGTPPTHTRFFRCVQEALEARPGDGPAAGPPPADGMVAGGVYVVRFLYERPRCLPRERQLLSSPTRTFLLAPFHDPDAPARPVRIVFPADPSPAGLRRFPRNVSTVLSAELRRQMHRVTEDTLREGKIGTPPTIDFGMVCQLSVPIISICALLLLMVVVAILNIVFFWLPLLKICAPVPKEG